MAWEEETPLTAAWTEPVLGAFQRGAFQANAFQVTPSPPWVEDAENTADIWAEESEL